MNRPAAVPNTVGVSGQVLATPGTFKGVSVRETAGATAAVRIYDNANAAAGVLLAAISLPANGSHSISIPDGVRVANGIYWSVVSGAVEGSVWVG